MRPPSYREAEMTLLGILLNSCFWCLHERQFRGVPVCLKYYAQVQMDKTCDDWDGGPLIGSAPELGLHGGMHYHVDIPDEDERATLEGGAITVLDE